MEYISAKEAAKKWQISPRQVQRLLAGKRIPYAKRQGRLWLIPGNAAKPLDRRHEKGLASPSLAADLANILAATTLPMPSHNPDAILNRMSEERLRFQYEAELAYLRGDFQKVLFCFQKTEGDDGARLRACPLALAAAASIGDYPFYTAIEAYLKIWLGGNKNQYVTAIAELAVATVAVSVIAPHMTPSWLKEGDLEALPPQARPDALYLRAKYFAGAGKHEAMLAVAQTALSLSSPEEGITLPGIYLRLTCASAYHYLGQDEKARLWLLQAMDIALPHGFITPFAELVTAFGGLMEQCLKKSYPQYYDAVIKQWKRTWKNWIAFHNQFTKDNITLVLTLREYHIALLVARRIPYADIARQHCISVGRLKNIMQGIYSKLMISGRDELAKYIF